MTFQNMNLNNSCQRFSVIFVNPLGSWKKLIQKGSNFLVIQIQTEHQHLVNLRDKKINYYDTVFNLTIISLGVRESTR